MSLSAHVLSCLPVSASQREEKLLNGISTSPNFPTGAFKSALYVEIYLNVESLSCRRDKLTRYPPYSLPLFTFNLSALQDDTSGNNGLPVSILMYPFPATPPSKTATPGVSSRRKLPELINHL